MASADNNNETTPIQISVSDIQYNFTWNYDGAELSDHLCGICKRTVDAPAIKCENNGNILSECVKGKCGHFFHTICMNAMIKTNNMSCQVCNAPWEYSEKYSSISVTDKNP